MVAMLRINPDNDLPFIRFRCRRPYKSKEHTEN
jgi:hypothetical protein